MFKLVERGHAQLPVNLQDLVRAQTRDAQHRQDALWDVLAHGLKRRVRPGAVELLDNVSDGFAYARNLTEAILRYEAHYESQPSVHSRSGSNRQYLPFADAKALAVYDGFERGAYQLVSATR